MGETEYKLLVLGGGESVPGVEARPGRTGQERRDVRQPSSRGRFSYYQQEASDVSA